MASKPVGFNRPLTSGQTIGLPSTMNLNRAAPVVNYRAPRLPAARPLNMTIPRKRAPLNAGPTGPASAEGASLLQALYDQTVGNTGPTSTSKSTQTTQQARSPELEQQIATQTGRLNDVSQGFQGAFQGKLNSFDDIIRSLATAYQSRASNESNAVGTSALQSGLTPVEATQRSSDTIGDILQTYYADRARTEGERANVPIALQEALQGVSQQHQGLLQSVIAPYQRDVAGTTTTGSQEQTDSLGQTSLLARLAQAMQQEQASGESQALEQAKLAQQGEQFLMQMALEQAGLQQKGELALLGERGATGRAQLGEQGSMSRLLQQLASQQGIAQGREQGATDRATAGNEADLIRTLLGEQGANTRANTITPFQSGSLQNQQQGQLMDYLASLAGTQQRGTTATNKATANAEKQKQLAQYRADTLAQRASENVSPEDKTKWKALETAITKGTKVKIDIGGKTYKTGKNFWRWLLPGTAPTTLTSTGGTRATTQSGVDTSIAGAIETRRRNQ